MDGVGVLLDFSLDVDLSLFSLDFDFSELLSELDAESPLEEPLLEALDFLPESRLSVR